MGHGSSLSWKLDSATLPVATQPRWSRRRSSRDLLKFLESWWGIEIALRMQVDLSVVWIAQTWPGTVDMKRNSPGFVTIKCRNASTHSYSQTSRAVRVFFETKNQRILTGRRPKKAYSVEYQTPCYKQKIHKSAARVHQESGPGSAQTTWVRFQIYSLFCTEKILYWDGQSIPVDRDCGGTKCCPWQVAFAAQCRAATMVVSLGTYYIALQSDNFSGISDSPERTKKRAAELRWQVITTSTLCHL